MFDIGSKGPRFASVNENEVSNRSPKGDFMSTILLVILILLLLGVVPAWPHSRNWGYGPSGGLGLVALILIVLLLMGRI